MNVSISLRQIIGTMLIACTLVGNYAANHGALEPIGPAPDVTPVIVPGDVINARHDVDTALAGVSDVDKSRLAAMWTALAKSVQPKDSPIQTMGQLEDATRTAGEIMEQTGQIRVPSTLKSALIAFMKASVTSENEALDENLRNKAFVALSALAQAAGG